MPDWSRIFHLPSDTTPLLADRPGDSDENRLSGDQTLERGDIEDNDPSAAETSSLGMSYDAVWSEPLGGPTRGNDDEYLLMFRRAVGINSDYSSDTDQLEEGQRTAVGIYRAIVREQRRKKLMHHSVTGLVWSCHGVQIVVGATLTVLGLRANEFPVPITVLGAINTAVAGTLALLKGKNLSEKLGKSEAEFQQLKAWIEETETLLALGVIGRDRREVGNLIETAFRRYNACFGRSFEVEADMDSVPDDLSMADEEEGGKANGDLGE